MLNLVLELRQGEVMIVNGAPIRFRTRSRIELTAKARFLFGKQIMPPDQAGLMLMLRWKTLPGSYVALTRASRSYFSPYAARTRWSSCSAIPLM